MTYLEQILQQKHVLQDYNWKLQVPEELAVSCNICKLKHDFIWWQKWINRKTAKTNNDHFHNYSMLSVYWSICVHSVCSFFFFMCFVCQFFCCCFLWKVELNIAFLYMWYDKFSERTIFTTNVAKFLSTAGTCACMPINKDAKSHCHWNIFFSFNNF